MRMKGNIKRNPGRTTTIRSGITRTVIILNAIILLLLASVLTTIANFSKASIFRKEVRLQAEYSGSRLEALIDSQKTFVKGIARSAEAYGLINDKDMMKTVIRGYNGELDDVIIDLYIAYSDNTVFMMTGNESKLPSDFKVVDRPWYQDAVKSKTDVAVSDPYVDAATGALLITISSPVNDKSGNTVGVIAEDFDLSHQENVLESINFKDGQDAFLLDKGNHYICRYEDGRISVPKKLTEKVPADIAKLIGQKSVSSYRTDSGKRFLYSYPLKDEGFIFCITQSDRALLISVMELIIIAVLILLISIIITVVVMSIVIRKNLQPVSEFKAFVKDSIIGGRSMPHMNTETEEISYLTNEMKTRFIGTIRETSSIAKDIGGSVADTTSQISRMNDSITEISATMEETAASVDEQTAKIQAIDSACREVESGVDDLAQKASDMAANSAKVIDKVDKVVAELMKSRDNTISITETSRRELSDAIEGAKSINDIVAISESISDISDQTSLLSLNASIEAARAGEAGLGFAVVAEQIQRLASNTSTQIDHINEIIDRVLSGVNTLSEKSQSIIDFINNNVLPDYSKFSDLADSYTSDAHYYSDVSGTLGATSEELSASITNITNSIGTISEIQTQLSKGIENINENLQSMSAGSATVVSAANSMKDQTGHLSRTVDSFNI